MSTTEEEEFIAPRWCIAHNEYLCDMREGGCEFLPHRDSEEYRISAGSAIGWRNLDDGRYVCIYVMGANFRLCTGADKTFIDRAWCYDRSKVEPIRDALCNWDGMGMPPDGWHRDLQTGMRRKNGDPEQEYYNL
jgi:hypothetical protein